MSNPTPCRMSFIVPAYNEAKLLGATLDAIRVAAALTGESFEIIVVDDDSTDSTAAIAAGRGARVVPVKNRSIARTRNDGARQARGEYLFFVDADTLIDHRVLRAALARLYAGDVGGGAVFKWDNAHRGVGRTGKLYGCQHANVKPDIMTLAKGIGGGVPLAALLATRAVSCFAPGDQGGTFNGNPLMAAVGHAVLRRINTPEFLQGVRDAAAHLCSGLALLAARHSLGGTQGRGLLLALDLGRDIGADLVTAARARGLLINSPKPHLLRFMPALNVTRAEIDTAMSRLDQALGDLD